MKGAIFRSVSHTAHLNGWLRQCVKARSCWLTAWDSGNFAHHSSSVISRSAFIWFSVGQRPNNSFKPTALLGMNGVCVSRQRGGLIQALGRNSLVPLVCFRPILAVLIFGNPVLVSVAGQNPHNLIQQPLLVVRAVNTAVLGNQVKHLFSVICHFASPSGGLRPNNSFKPTPLRGAA